MSLVFIIPILCFLTSFIHVFTKKIFGSFTYESFEEKRLNTQIKEIRAEMRKISMRDNYTSYIKLERKAVALENEQNQIRNANLVKRTAIKYGLQYGFNGLCSLILVFISIYYRYTPVIVFDSRYNFTPFGGLMAFPCGVQNGVSIPFWIVTSSFANKVLASYVK